MVQVPVRFMTLSGGFVGTDQTVALMSQLAMGPYGARSPKIQASAVKILKAAQVAPKDYTSEMVAIHNWVRDNIRYTRDVVGQETLYPPEYVMYMTQAGDCLIGSTRLLTPSGYKAIADVRPGDTVQGRNGWTKVTQWWDKGTLPVKRYSLSNGGSFVATDDHRCIMLDGAERCAGMLAEGDALLGPGLIKPTGDGKLSEADAYFIGLYLADGWEDANRVCIAGKDGSAKEQQKLWVKDYAAAKGWSTSWHPRYIRVYVPKDEPISVMIRTGAVAPDKEIPAALWGQLTAATAKRLLTGLLADSHQPGETRRALDAVEKRKSKPRRSGLCYSTVSEELAKQVRLLFRMDGVSCKITKVVDHGGLGTHPVYRIYPRYFMAKPAKVRGIETEGTQQVYDIETEDHGIYLPDADVVVHNCDDMSMLVAALVGSVGIPTRFKVIGQTPGSYSHVYLEARPQNDWIPLDPIMRDKPAGWEAPASTAVISKTFPENTPDGLDTSMTRNMNGLGYYIGDQRMVSHLSEDPGQPAPSPNYVQMDSMLDTDLPIEAISNNQPAFPQNANARVMGATLQQRRPQLMDNTQVPAWAYARMQQDQDDQAAMESAAMAPMNGLNDLMGPDEIAGIGHLAMLGDPVSPNMQRPALAQTPEGIDTQFGRRALVVRSDTGDRIIYHGLTALSERPPIAPVRGLAGVQRSGALPGMGRLAGRNLGYLAGRGMSGPGMADLADDAAGSPTPAPMPVIPAPSSGMSHTALFGLALLGVGAYLFCKRK